MRSSRRSGRERDARVRKLCRRLGFGLLAVSVTGTVSINASPEGAMPRRNHRRRSRIVEEHRKRRGDPMPGGGARAPIMTAYRQEALACAAKVRAGLQCPRDLKSPRLRTRQKFCIVTSTAGLTAPAAASILSQR